MDSQLVRFGGWQTMKWTELRRGILTYKVAMKANVHVDLFVYLGFWVKTWWVPRWLYKKQFALTRPTTLSENNKTETNPILIAHWRVKTKALSHLPIKRNKSPTKKSVKFWRLVSRIGLSLSGFLKLPEAWWRKYGALEIRVFSIQKKLQKIRKEAQDWGFRKKEKKKMKRGLKKGYNKYQEKKINRQAFAHSWLWSGTCCP